MVFNESTAKLLVFSTLGFGAIANFLGIISCDLVTYDIPSGSGGNLGLFLYELKDSSEGCLPFTAETAEDSTFGPARAGAISAFTLALCLLALNVVHYSAYAIPQKDTVFYIIGATMQLSLALVQLLWRNELCETYGCRMGDGSYHAASVSTTTNPSAIRGLAVPTAQVLGTSLLRDDRDDDGHLATCQQLMQQPSSPFADGSFLTRTTTPVVWKLRHDGSRELTLPLTCHLKRYTSHEAQKCLAGEHLWFIGDSLTRYQHLSLAYFLEHDKWPARFSNQVPCTHIDESGNATCSPTEDPNVCAEGDWNKFGGWPVYLRAVGGGTDGSIFRGRMESQSIRTDGKAFENHQYISSKVKGSTKLSYTAEAGWMGMEQFSFGWNFTGCAHTGSCRYTQEEYDKKLKQVKDKEYDWNITAIVDAFGPEGGIFHEQHPDPHYVFYNRGLWGNIQQDKAEKMMALLYNYTSKRCFYRSTTGSERTRQDQINEHEDTVVRRTAYAHGCEYIDVGHLTKEFSTTIYMHPAPPPNKMFDPPRHNMFEYLSVFWDSVHYQPWVYEELNTVLLNILCNTRLV